MVVIINLIIIDHSRMIQAFRLREISKYDDGCQLMSAAKLCLEAVNVADLLFSGGSSGMQNM